MTDTLSAAFLKARQEYEKKFGDLFFVPASERPQETRFVPTGCFPLDRQLKGGVPVNRATLFVGRKGSFKTTMALKVAKNYQQRCGHCLRLLDFCLCGQKKQMLVAYIDAEHGLDMNHVAHLGINTETFYVADPPYAEAACDLVKDMSKIEDVGLLIVDSISALMPVAESEKSAMESTRLGERASLVHRLYRGLIANLRATSGTPRIVIAVNHILQSKEGFEYYPGGEAPKNYSSVIIKLWRQSRGKLELSKDGFPKKVTKGQESSKEEITRDTIADYVDTRKHFIGFSIDRSKVSADDVGGEFILSLVDDGPLKYGDVEDWKALLQWVLAYQVVAKNGASYQLDTSKLNGTSPEMETTFAKQTDILAYWQQNRLVFEYLKDEMVRMSWA